MRSPTQRSLKYLRDTRGCLADVCERWIPGANVRKDLFGIVDIVAINDEGRWLVQTTSRSNMSARIKKIRESEALPVLLKAGFRVVVHGWSKDSKGKWVLREVEINAS